jgi:type IV pilus assembly protein PilZ
MEGKCIYDIAAEETYHDGQIIFKEGSSGDWLYIILSGSVEISKSVGDQKYVIEILRADEVFGELGFIGRIERTATAQAIGETALGIIDREPLDKEYNKLSIQFRSILEAITCRSKKMLDRAREFSKRSAPRIPQVLSLVFKDRQSFFQAYTGNISTGGLFIKTDNPLSSGHRFLLKLQLPGIPDPMEIKCRVMWARKVENGEANRPPGMGIKFCEIPKEDYLRLKEYLATSESDE